MKKAVLFGFSDFTGGLQAANLTNRMMPLGIEVRVVEREDYLQPLGVVAGVIPPSGPFGAAEEYEGKELPVRIVLFAGVEQAELETVLSVCRECGITSGDLKAMLTPTNVAWSAVKLCEELIMEHYAMGGS